ncbi:MAG: hypothetical protein DRO18_04195 [Thermoprotei archaeon]|nr:MAG: hypothetical protein DRO18_04195 [Thermoprotei archaeon]
MIEVIKFYKEPKGKYVEIIAKADESCTIKEFLVNGDFFMIPPEAIDQLEDTLKGLRIVNVDELMDRVSKLLANTRVIGLGKNKLIELIRDVLSDIKSKCREHLK